MREILFRAKQHYTKEWLYGAVVKDEDECLITVGEPDGLYKQKMTVVEESTVGQFTGLVDKNGKKIFEGDIFTSDYFDDTYNFEVVFSDGAFCGKHKSIGIYMLGFTNFDDNGEDLGYWCEEDYTSHIQIIGNIHDNPKLLS